MSLQQQTLAEYKPATKTTQITRTICLKLESSQRKRRRVTEVVEKWQRMADHFADQMPSQPRDRWGEVQSVWQSELAQREFPTDDLDIRAHERDQALHKVSEAFGAWRERGMVGDRPTFGDGEFMRLCHCGIKLAENDRGYGVKLSLQPYKPEWFHINTGQFQRQWLKQVMNSEASTGSAELHFHDGDLFLHLTVSTDVEVHEKADITRWLGVDLGERVLYAAAVVEPSAEVHHVELESGREFRHHREELDRKREAAMRDKRVDEISTQRQRYTEQITHTATRHIIDIALEHRPIGIRIEDLGGYRETQSDAIHDWPHHKIRSQIAYKAIEKGIPVEEVAPAHTSTTCRKCGNHNPAMRSGDAFECWGCGYEVHADVNAAINIGLGGVK